MTKAACCQVDHAKDSVRHDLEGRLIKEYLSSTYKNIADRHHTVHSMKKKIHCYKSSIIYT